MKSLLSCVILGVALFVGSDVARAALLSVDLVPGSGDVLITRDTESGLEWLDHSLSLGRSYVDVSSNFDIGEDFEGFRYSTQEEVNEFILHAGLPANALFLPNVAAFGSVLDATAIALVQQIGGTFSATPTATSALVRGIIDLPADELTFYAKDIVLYVGHLPGSKSIRHTLNDCCFPSDTGTPVISSWLVRSIPEPAISVLLVSALLAIGITRVRCA